MKLKYLFNALFLTLVFISCSRDDNNDSGSTTTKPDEINNFVWKAMNSWYYWQPNVPNLADSFDDNLTSYANFLNGKTPDKLFYSLLYQRETVDRFSWIENNNEIVYSSKIAEVEKSGGFDIGIYPKDNTNTNAVALVNYVVPNSPAALAGLKRGDVITKVNGSPLTLSNSSLLYNSQVNITLAATVQLLSTGIITTDKTSSISITQADIDENPVAYYEKKVYGTKNIGYLVFNAFKADYNDELNAAFAQMKTDGINELVLDLRYNGGGSLETAIALAGMINNNFSGSPYVYLDFNNKHNSEDGFDYLSNQVNTYSLVNNRPEKSGTQAINSLNLTKVYVLVNFQTASASELTVQCLKKYVNVVTIGYDTVGKFVGSITLYDSPSQDYTSYANRNTKHNWQLQPITFSYYNKDKDVNPTYINPDYAINPYSIFNNLTAFGDVRDPFLKKALELITGQTFRMSNTATSSFENKNLQRFNPTNAAKGLYIQDFQNFR
ncbi:S41 family peptidase [Cloacibacterium sp. TD35]|uniref:S41 family peptidase n=1 Tax=Cloacibacterium sp. TD35 TaxID=2976818 RepID=UPI00237E66C0|nr:S41 family peptidase [Cloacibacterium sp. TD35]WDT68513.1 S41 family peptidase [Cloacibacterium sp. TD35]